MQITLPALLQALRELECGTFELDGNTLIIRSNADDCVIAIEPNGHAELHGDGVDDCLSSPVIMLIDPST